MINNKAYNFVEGTIDDVKCRICRSHTTSNGCVEVRKILRLPMNGWIEEVEQSKLSQFNTFINTLKKYQVHIVQYFNGRYLARRVMPSV